MRSKAFCRSLKCSARHAGNAAPAAATARSASAGRPTGSRASMVLRRPGEGTSLHSPSIAATHCPSISMCRSGTVVAVAPGAVCVVVTWLPPGIVQLVGDARRADADGSTGGYGGVLRDDPEGTASKVGCDHRARTLPGIRLPAQRPTSGCFGRKCHDASGSEGRSVTARPNCWQVNSGYLAVSTAACAASLTTEVVASACFCTAPTTDSVCCRADSLAAAAVLARDLANSR